MSASSPIKRQRRWILLALVVGIGVYTSVTLGLVHRLSEGFGPQVEADLVWRAQRGAPELANTTDLGLAVSDAAMVREAFGVYSKSADVQAIVAVDAAGKVVAQHGVFEDTAAVFAEKPGTLIRGPGYFASWAPAAIEGNVVGKVAVVVSTARLADAQTMLHGVSRTTVIAGIVALVLGSLVISFFTRAVAVRDRQLQDHVNNLARKVEERTRELDTRNRGMRLVLDNVAQGFMTIDLHGVIAPERSAIVERWFGAIDPGTTFDQVVERSSPDVAVWVTLSLDSLRDQILPLELCLYQMPARFSKGEQTFDIVYSPITTEGVVASLLVIVSDVTAEIGRERTQREQQELIEMFRRITTDRAGFDEFVAEATRLVEELRTPADAVTERRTIHTLKGNCGLYGIRTYAALCHEVETDAEQGDVLPRHRERLLAGWDEVKARLATFRHQAKPQVIQVEPAELAAIVERARAGASSRELGDAIAALAHEPIATRFERLARMATELGQRLDKPEIEIEVAGGGMRLAAEPWSAVWASMVHLVRNAVDHGIESTADRVAAGKPPHARLTFAANRLAGRLTISLSDDGRGIDWQAVREAARTRGLRAKTQGELVEALFHEGISTRETATEVSGRGVGLGGLRATVEQLGGAVEVHSVRGEGTTFELVFPDPDVATPIRSTRGALTA